ncbi:MAG: hypothetical protein Q9186_007666 [Xanthomendoza sp. 1 TL-2023]
MPPPAKPSLIASHDFAKPILPRHSTNGSKRSRASSVHSPSVRLSIIEEDAASHPPMPPRAHHRPFHRRWNLGDPPRSSFESPPPKYSVWDTMGPKGSYNLSTHLSTIRTDCTSNPALWSCYPSNQTYSTSPSKSLADLTWIITSSPSSPSTFTISSTANPFSIGSFASTPLTKLDAGTPEERYHFSTESEKITFPTIGESCYFNGTVIEGDLYTKKPKTYPATTTAGEEEGTKSSDNDKAFQPWPFAVDIRQKIAGGSNTPQCFRMQGNRQGDRVTEGITSRLESEMCSCEYRNFGS